MPLYGLRDVASEDAYPPEMDISANRAEELTGVQILQLLFEGKRDVALELIPSAFHPTNPPAVTITIIQAAESPWGSFSMAHVGVLCRAGVRLRTYGARSIVSSEVVAQELQRGWGFRTTHGDVRVRRYYDEIQGIVALDDTVILDATLVDPKPLGPEDMFYIDFMNYAGTSRGDRLVQVDPLYDITLAARGRPKIATLDGSAWGDARLRTAFPITSTFTECSLTLPKLRFMCRLDEPALTGTERLEDIE